MLGLVDGRLAISASAASAVAPDEEPDEQRSQHGTDLVDDHALLLVHRRDRFPRSPCAKPEGLGRRVRGNGWHR
jgi:hypothetical protein